MNPNEREINFGYSTQFLPILQSLGGSLLVSTYQAGKMAVVGVHAGKLTTSFHTFERAMGIAASRHRLAVGTREQVWVLRQSLDIAPRLQPAGQYDACFLARGSHYTGEIHIHEMCWSGNRLWVCNTLFSCLAEIDDQHSFVPRWRPRFISELAAEDRCHLNGVAMEHGAPKYVTAFGESNTPFGWRERKATAGCLIDVASGETILRSLSMPHSPRVFRGNVWLLDSGNGSLLAVDVRRGTAEVIATLPGYARGLAFFRNYAFVGLSKIREMSTFGGVAVAERRDRLRCGVAIIDLQLGASVAWLEFRTGIEEIFDVQVLAGIRAPMVSGPFTELDGGTPIWVVPDSAR